MEKYTMQLCIAGISINIEADFPIAYAEKCIPFLSDNDTKEISMKFYCDELPNIEGYFHIYEGKEYDILQKEERYICVFYRNYNKKEIDFYTCFANETANFYEVYLSDSRLAKRTINPLQYVEISLLLIPYDTIVLHCSVIDTNGRGVLFTAPSGTGKSTQAELWEKYKGAEIINGDRGFIRMQEGKYMAYGSWYAGSSRIYKNKRIPVTTVVVLRQAKENKIKRLSKKEAYIYLLSEISASQWNRKVLEKQCEWLLEFLDKIPVYLLECRPDLEAVEVLEKELRR